MWCRFGVTLSAIALISVPSLVSYETVSVAQSRRYTSTELLAALKGLGYNVGTTLSSSASIKAIREFQQDYKLNVDGIAGRQTQGTLAQLVDILQANLNLVVKPNPPLPRSQFYTARTVTVVKQFQKNSNSTQTGIADFPLRLRLDNDAKKILGIPATATPAPTTTTSPSLAPSPAPSESPSESPAPSESPSESPSPTPSVSPS